MVFGNFSRDAHLADRVEIRLQHAWVRFRTQGTTLNNTPARPNQQEKKGFVAANES